MKLIVVVGELVEGEIYAYRFLVDQFANMFLEELGLESADPANYAHATFQ